VLKGSSKLTRKRSVQGEEIEYEGGGIIEFGSAETGRGGAAGRSNIFTCPKQLSGAVAVLNFVLACSTQCLPRRHVDHRRIDRKR
jgi:phage portal protein BeeE